MTLIRDQSMPFLVKILQFDRIFIDYDENANAHSTPALVVPKSNLVYTTINHQWVWNEFITFAVIFHLSFATSFCLSSERVDFHFDWTFVMNRRRFS